MQLKYWDLKSQEKLREAQGTKATAETSRIEMLAPLEREELMAKTNNLIKELDLIVSKTKLTDIQKDEAISKIVNNYVKSAKDISSEVRGWIELFQPKSQGGGSLSTLLSILKLIL